VVAVAVLVLLVVLVVVLDLTGFGGVSVVRMGDSVWFLERRDVKGEGVLRGF